jgi:hypothetical protein
MTGWTERGGGREKEREREKGGKCSEDHLLNQPNHLVMGSEKQVNPFTHHMTYLMPLRSIRNYHISIATLHPLIYLLSSPLLPLL